MLSSGLFSKTILSGLGFLPECPEDLVYVLSQVRVITPIGEIPDEPNELYRFPSSRLCEMHEPFSCFSHQYSRSGENLSWIVSREAGN